MMYMKLKYKRIGIVIGLLLVLFVALAGCSGEEASEIKEPADGAETAEDTDFKTECEKNANEYPAKAGAVLVTKGNYNFTGMNYYFRGEVIKFNLIENDVGDPNVWLVKNENGYVMPIQYNQFEAQVGDTVEVWGTLSGNGYANIKEIDNVVGETGSMIAMQVTINGEAQY